MYDGEKLEWKIENQPFIYEPIRVAIKRIEEKKYCPLMAFFIKDERVIRTECGSPDSVKSTKRILSLWEGWLKEYKINTFLLIFQRKDQSYLVVNIFTREQDVGGVIPFIRSGETIKCDAVSWDRDEEIQFALQKMAQSYFKWWPGQDDDQVDNDDLNTDL